MNFDIIKVNWLDKRRYNLDSLVKEPDFKDCLYQAYGDSPIYGRDALLYIGQTNGFIRRTSEHIKSDFNRINNLSLIVGRIETDEAANLTVPEAMKVAEVLLITMLKPSYNSSNIKDIVQTAKTNKYLILNFGNRNALPLEVSNYWW